MKLKLLFSAFCSLALITGVNIDTHAASSPKLVQSKYNPNLMVDKSLSVYMINGREIYEYFPELSYLREERFFSNLARLEGVPQAAFGNMLAHLNKMLTTTDGLDLTHEIFRFTNFYFNDDYLETIKNDDLVDFGMVEHLMHSIAEEFYKYWKDSYNKEIFLSYGRYSISIYPEFIYWIRENTKIKDLREIIEKTQFDQETKVYFDMYIMHKAKEAGNFPIIFELSRDNLLKLINVTSRIVYKFWDFYPKKSIDFMNSFYFSNHVIGVIYMPHIMYIIDNLSYIDYYSKTGTQKYLEYNVNSQLWWKNIANWSQWEIRKSIKDIVVNMVLEKDPKQFEYYHGKLPEPKKSN